MILSISELVERLQVGSEPNDTGPRDALWIRFAEGKRHNTVEYRTADGNQIVHVYLGQDGSIVGLEIFQ